MKKEEAQVLRHDMAKLIEHKGIPINIRNGSNTDAAEWITGIFDKCVQIDEPLGVIVGIEYDECPSCRHVVGFSALYCKHCGALIREKVKC